MTPGKYDLALYRGDSYRWTFTLWQDPAGTVPLVLSGVTGKAEIRDKSGGTLIIPLTLDASYNTLIVTLTAAQCKTCPASGVWDLQLTWSDGSVTTIVAGTVTTTPDVTDSITPAGFTATPAARTMQLA